MFLRQSLENNLKNSLIYLILHVFQAKIRAEIAINNNTFLCIKWFSDGNIFFSHVWKRNVNDIEFKAHMRQRPNNYDDIWIKLKFSDDFELLKWPFSSIYSDQNGSARELISEGKLIWNI